MRTVVAVSVLAFALTSCTSSPAASTPETRTSPAAPTASHTSEQTSDLAESFSLPCVAGMQKRVVGVRRTIVGAVFGRPLTSPPSQDHRNKILWITRHPGRRDLVISASLNGSDVHVERRVDGGPGPSIINLPEPGCWTFSLRWEDNHDVVAVRYLPR